VWCGKRSTCWEMTPGLLTPSRLVLARNCLTALAIGAAAILCLRASVGPVHLGPFTVGSLLPLEQIFWVVLILLGLLARNGPAMESGKNGAAPLLPIGGTLILVALFFCWNLHDSFLSDDYILIGRTSLDLQAVKGYFTNPGGDGAFRPIGDLYFALAGHWAGLEPWKWHLCGLILHLLNCALLYFFTWILWANPVISLNSALVFGLHGTRPEVVVWTAGNFDSLACCFSLAALICAFLSRDSRRSYAYLLLVAGFLTLAIWSKESAYAFPLMLIGFWWAAKDLRRPGIRRSLVCAVLVSTALFVHRWALFGGPGGYSNPATGRPAVLSLSLLSSAKALLLRLWAILLFPINWDAGDDLGLPVCAALSAGLVLWLVLGANRKSFRTYAALLGMTACALLPAIHLALIGESCLGSRILYLPSVGFSVLCAHLIATYKSSASRAITQTALVVSVSVLLAYNLHGWHQTAHLADRFCADIATGREPMISHPPSVMHGVFFFANGLSECVSMKKDALPVPPR
jgi:hypothetical protein